MQVSIFKSRTRSAAILTLFLAEVVVDFINTRVMAASLAVGRVRVKLKAENFVA